MKRLWLTMAGLAFIAMTALPSLATADSDVNTVPTTASSDNSQTETLLASQPPSLDNFVVTNFAADETLSRADPQGELHVIEHINLTFSANNHGILRAIPTRYKSHSLQLHVNRITSDTNAPVSYTTYDSNGNSVLKIGDPDQTVTGAQEYTIDYTVRNVISFYPDHDELYWDVNGDQWSQPFISVSATVHLPSGLQFSLPPKCFTGSFGSTAANCTLTTPTDTIQVSTTQPLSANQTLTYAAAFEPGYFRPSKWYETAEEYHAQAFELTLPIVILGGLGYIWWWRRGRDPKGTGIIIPQYDAPDGLKPVQLGTLQDFRTDNTDITATIVDLAIRKYIKIIETTQKRLGKDKQSYSLELLNSDYSALDVYETQLMQAIFTDPTLGQPVELSALKNKLYSTADTIRTGVSNDLKTQGYIRGSSVGIDLRKVGPWLIFRFIIIIFVFGLGVANAKTAWGIVGLVIGFGILLGFMLHLSARTAKGVAALEHLKGLKLYLEVAEKDRLEKLQGPNAAYAANAGEPVKTVELFEKLLPYAMVLGVEQQWAKQFESLYTTPPDWYNGNWTTFNALYLTSSLNSGLSSAINSSFSAPSSSSSSGFGGGGFSGGGGGGGGGGGW